LIRKENMTWAGGFLCSRPVPYFGLTIVIMSQLPY